jgi:hypothetical protein
VILSIEGKGRDKFVTTISINLLILPGMRNLKRLSRSKSSIKSDSRTFFVCFDAWSLIAIEKSQIFEHSLHFWAKMRFSDFGSILEKDGLASITIADSTPTLNRVDIENVRPLISSSSDLGTGEFSFLRRRTGSFDGEPLLRISIGAVSPHSQILID